VNLPPAMVGRFIFASGAAPTEFSVVICFSPLVGLPDSLVRKDQREVCPLSRGVILPKAQLLFIPLRNGIRFLPHPLTASLSICLTAYLPHRERYGLTVFRLSAKVGEVLSIRRQSFVHNREVLSPCADRAPFWSKPISIFGLL
jgi:hypothetical protein